MIEQGTNLVEKEIFDEVCQFYKFVKNTKSGNSDMNKVLFLGILELTVLFLANIIWIIVLIILFSM
jgi:hypothetical protein